MSNDNCRTLKQNQLLFWIPFWIIQMCIRDRFNNKCNSSKMVNQFYRSGSIIVNKLTKQLTPREISLFIGTCSLQNISNGYNVFVLTFDQSSNQSSLESAFWFSLKLSQRFWFCIVNIHRNVIFLVILYVGRCFSKHDMGKNPVAAVWLRWLWYHSNLNFLNKTQLSCPINNNMIQIPYTVIP